MDRDFLSGSIPLNKTYLWLVAIPLSIPFVIAFVVHAVVAFSESPESGWWLVFFVLILPFLLIVGLGAVAAVVLGVPRKRTWLAARRQHPGSLVLMCRRSTTTAKSASAWTGRATLMSGSDEFFILVVSNAQLDLYRSFSRGRSIIRLAHFDKPVSISVAKRDAFSGRYYAIEIEHPDGDRLPFSFFVLSPRLFAVIPRRKRKVEAAAEALAHALIGLPPAPTAW